MGNDLHQNIFVVTGKVQSGKTTYLNGLVDTLKSEGYRVSGFLCRGSFENNERSGFELTDIRTGRSYTLASVHEQEEWVKFRKFYFDPLVLEAGARILLNGLRQRPDLIVIDEVGPMELEGLGWYRALDLMVKEYRTAQVWVVREGVLEDVLKRWNIPPVNVVRADPDAQEAGDQLIERLKRCINH